MAHDNPSVKSKFGKTEQRYLDGPQRATFAELLEHFHSLMTQSEGRGRMGINTACRGSKVTICAISLRPRKYSLFLNNIHIRLSASATWCWSWDCAQAKRAT